jgi:hypothetical protein
MGQHTRVRLTPLPLNLEDLSRLWSVLFQTEYRLSVIYQASVVLVTEEEPAPQPVLPVRERQIFVVPTLAPVIQTLSPATVLPSGQLTIHAQHVQGGKVQVVLDDQLVVPPDKVTLDPAGHLLITALPPELQAGVHTLRVAHTVDTGSAAAPDVRRCGESNVVAFVVQPHIIAQPAFAKPLLTLTVEPPVQPEQAVTLWLDEIAVALGHSPQVYGLLPQARQEPGNTLTFDVSQVTPGTYQLRVRVDRAEGPAEPAMTWTCSADPVVTP